MRKLQKISLLIAILFVSSLIISVFAVGANSSHVYNNEIIRKTAIDNQPIQYFNLDDDDAGTGDDAGDSFAFATQITEGEYNGTLTVADDDYYRFSVGIGVIINITMAAHNLTNDFDVTLYAQDSTYIKNNPKSAGFLETILWSAGYSGNYSILINSAISDFGNYSFSIELISQNDFGTGNDAGNDITSPISIVEGSSNGTLVRGSDDWDFYDITLENGDIINIFLEWINPINIELSLHDIDGSLLYSSTKLIGFNESIYAEPISPGCMMCAEGSKMVILITGLCPAHCFYCPLSLEKTGRDRIFADEWELENESDIGKLIKEAELISATGAGITGGDPLVVWERTKKYIKILKNHFGLKFHIHLYTSGLEKHEHAIDLVDAGLDEIRFHPMPKFWSKMQKTSFQDTILKLVSTDCDVALEIPVIPGKKDDVLSLIHWANDVGIKWVNLNELEYSETNAELLNQKGFTVKDDISSAVKDSQETAYDVIKKTLDLDIGVHYCSSSFKDGIQLRNRIKRRAKNIAKNSDVITDDGTILKGIVTSSNKKPEQIYQFLIDGLKIEEQDMYIDEEKNRLEISPDVLEKISDKLKSEGFECFIVEEYPTADRLEVEKIPL